MKYRSDAALGLVMLALCVILLVTLVQSFTATPLQTTSRPLASPIEPVIPTVDVASTADAERLSLVATLSAEATATSQAMPPQPTPGAIVGPKTLRQDSSGITLELPEGWYALMSVSSSGPIAIANYDLFSIEKPPDDGIRMEMGFGPLPDDTQFEAWVRDRKTEATMPEKGGYAATTSEIEPYSTGQYSGFTFTTNDVLGQIGQSIYLLVDNRQIIAISLRPVRTENTYAAKALEILDTLKLDSSKSTAIP
jgi:hypothetical protein